MSQPNADKYFIICFDRQNNLPHFVEERFDSEAAAEKYFDAHENELVEKNWNIQFYRMDKSRNFIEL